jgi:hypothetical protein
MIRIGERVRTESGNVYGMLADQSASTATIRTADGFVNVPVHSIRRTTRTVRPLAPVSSMPDAFDYYVVVQIRTDEPVYMGECIASAANALNPGTCYAGADDLGEAVRLAKEQAAAFRKLLVAVCE